MIWCAKADTSQILGGSSSAIHLAVKTRTHARRRPSGFLFAFVMLKPAQVQQDCRRDDQIAESRANDTRAIRGVAQASDHMRDRAMHFFFPEHFLQGQRA